MLLLKGTWKGLKKKQSLPTLTHIEEESLCSYIRYYASRAVPLSTAMVRTFATLLANRKGRLCDQKFKGKAGVGWFQKFKRRHPEITLRNPASLDMGHVSMSSESVVEDHFNKLTGLLHEISPECIWNVDEVGFGQVFIQLLFVFSISDMGSQLTIVCDPYSLRPKCLAYPFLAQSVAIHTIKQ